MSRWWLFERLMPYNFFLILSGFCLFLCLKIKINSDNWVKVSRSVVGHVAHSGHKCVYSNVSKLWIFNNLWSNTVFITLVSFVGVFRYILTKENQLVFVTFWRREISCRDISWIRFQLHYVSFGRQFPIIWVP